MKFSMILSSYLPHELPGIVRAVERSGFDGLSMPDHPVHPVKVAPTYPYGKKDGAASESSVSADSPQLDPWVVGGFLAAASPKLHYMTSVYLPLFRHPLATAKAIATLSGLLGGNRFVFGVGMGWMPEEFQCLGVPWTERGARLDEVLDILQLMWAGGEVEYHGRYYNFPAIGTNPVPPYPIPLYFGGHSDQMLVRAAKRGDGWICAPKPEMLEPQITRLRNLREELGRADKPFEFVAMCSRPEPAIIEKMASLGVTRVIMLTPWKPDLPTGPTVAGQKADLIERLGVEVAKFR